MNNEPHERMENLEITLLDDGSVELKQGFLEEVFVTIHPCHLDHLAKLTGYVREDEVERKIQQACARLHDRVEMLAALLTAYAKDDERLRLLVEACMGAKNAAGAKGAASKMPATTSSIARNGRGQQLDLTYFSTEDSV